MPRDLTITGPTFGPPRWCGDFLSPERLYRGPNQIDATAFVSSGNGAVTVVVGAAGAAAGAVSVPVDALSGPIPAGTILDFGADKFAKLSADAAAGAVTIATVAIPTALVDDDTATYPGTSDRKVVVSGTVVSRSTMTDKWVPAVDGHDFIAIVAFDVVDADNVEDVELVRSGMGTTIKTNYLPVYDTLSAAVKAKLLAEYNLTEGHE